MNSSVMEEPTTILVVDDEKVIRDGCALALKPEGYRVTTAENGQQALEVLARESIQVVLCDLKMPVMGALEVLKEMAKNHPDIPLIIITGHGTVDNAVECMRKGAYDFITKPFRLDHLILCVRRALTKYRLERQAREFEAERARNLYSLALEQSRMHTIVHCMGDGVLVTNRGLEVVLVNAALYQLLGLGQIDPARAPGRICPERGPPRGHPIPGVRKRRAQDHPPGTGGRPPAPPGPERRLLRPR